MSDALVTWHVFHHNSIKQMFKKQPCQAKLTMRILGLRRSIKGHLVLPAQVGVRVHDAYQKIITLDFPGFNTWPTERRVEHAAKYLRIAEVKFGLEITKIMFRGKEVTCE